MPRSTVVWAVVAGSVSLGMLAATSAACGGSSDDTTTKPVADAGHSTLDAGIVVATDDAAPPGSTPDGGSGGRGGNGDASAEAGADAGEAIATPNEIAGTRLRPTYQRRELADGTVQLTPLGMQDTLRGEACSEMMMSDGQYHCAPAGEPMRFDPATYFSDAACTSPVIGTFPEAPLYEGADCTTTRAPETNRYFRSYSGDSVCGSVDLIPFPTTPSLDLKQIYFEYQGTCQPYSLLSTTSYSIWAAPLPPVSPSSFVQLTRSQPAAAGTGRLRTANVQYVGADGSSWVEDGALVDTSRSEFCQPTIAADGATRCLPDAGTIYDSLGFEFSDPACTVRGPIGVGVSEVCSKDPRYTFASYMNTSSDVMCTLTQGVTLYPIFSEPPLPYIYYLGSPGQCVQGIASGQGGDDYFARTALPAAIAPAVFAAVTSTSAFAPVSYGVDGSRIQVGHLHLSSADGFSGDRLATVLHDTKSLTDCTPTTLQDGATYCVPSYRELDYDAQSYDYFADAACTEPLFGVNLPPSCPAATPDPAALYATPGRNVAGCDATTLYHLPATPLTLTTVYGNNGAGPCSALLDATDNVAFYRASDCTVVPPSSFVAVTKLTTETP